MERKVKQLWEDFLNPEITRPRLIAASIYIAAFDALKDSIVGRIRSFFCPGFDEYGDTIDPKYQSEVLSLNRSPVYASLEWLKKMQAIKDSDVAAFDRVKACRNTLAHRLLSMLSSEGLPSDFDHCFDDMAALLRKIEVWWITNVDIPTNPDYDSSKVDEGRIVPGSIMLMHLLMDIAFGDEDRSRFYYDEFRKRAGS